jgi:TrmH family RNA methyltransferase
LFLVVVLVAPRNPLNIGAAARAMSNFGFLRLRVVNPYEVAYAEAKSAVNAAAVLEASEQFATVAEAIADCSLVVGTTAIGHRVLQHPLRRLEHAAKEIRAHAASGQVAILFGSEKFGLSNEDMARCHWLMHIPTRDEHQSMNLGQAVAVCLYELIRREEATVQEAVQKRAARAEDVDRVADLLVEAMEESGYLKDLTRESGEQKIRRLVRRMEMREADAAMWLGMLRQILWKLKSMLR